MFSIVIRCKQFSIPFPATSQGRCQAHWPQSSCCILATLHQRHNVWNAQTFNTLPTTLLAVASWRVAVRPRRFHFKEWSRFPTLIKSSSRSSEAFFSNLVEHSLCSPIRTLKQTHSPNISTTTDCKKTLPSNSLYMMSFRFSASLATMLSLTRLLKKVESLDTS